MALPLLAQLSPRVDGLLEKEQEPAAREVEDDRRKDKDAMMMSTCFFEGAPWLNTTVVATDVPNRLSPARRSP